MHELVKQQTGVHFEARTRLEP